MEALLHQSRMIIKDNADGKSSQWAESQAAQLVIHFAWKEKFPSMQLYTNSWAEANCLTRWSGTYKECNLKIGDDEV